MRSDAWALRCGIELMLYVEWSGAQVGVPEQSFDFWAAKFLAAGYKGA